MRHDFRVSKNCAPGSARLRPSWSCVAFACPAIFHTPNTMIGSAGRIAARRAPTTAVRRMSTAEPKMHKAKEWQVIKDSRPKTHDHVSSFGCRRSAQLKMYHVLRTLPTDFRGSGSDIARSVQYRSSASHLSLFSITAYLPTSSYILLLSDFFCARCDVLCCETLQSKPNQNQTACFRGRFPQARHRPWCACRHRSRLWFHVFWNVAPAEEAGILEINIDAFLSVWQNGDDLIKLLLCRHVRV